MLRNVVLAVSLMLLGTLSSGSGAGLFDNRHLERLAEWFTLSGEKVKGYWIYAENTGSGFVPVTALNEGDFCVDDVARVVLLYSEAYELTRNEVYFQLAKDASKFVLKMHAGDGEFYNFAYRDGTINRFGPTSYKSTSWWAQRALWGLSKLAQFWDDPELRTVLQRTYAALRRSPPKFGDQLSLYALGLADYYKATGRPEVLADLRSAVEELLKYRWGRFSSLAELYSAYRDRLNWNGWGNHYAEAFLEAYKLLNDERLLNAAQRIIEEQGTLMISSGLIYHIGYFVKPYPELAYALECLSVASKKLYDVTKDVRHAYLAALLSSWLFGGNRLSVRMYGPNGEGFDGLEFAHVNRNAGAESTICALRTVLYLENLPSEFVELATKPKILARGGLFLYEAEALDPGVSSFRFQQGDFGGGISVRTEGRARFKGELGQAGGSSVFHIFVSGQFNRTTVTVSSVGSSESVRKELSGSGIFELGKLRISESFSVSLSDSCAFDQILLIPDDIGVSFVAGDGVSSLVYNLTKKELSVVRSQFFKTVGRAPSMELPVTLTGTGNLRFVDLRSVFNNDGFATPLLPGNFDNLGGVIGAYLPANEVTEGELDLSNVKFLLHVNGPDNVRCSGQRLYLEPPVLVRNVHLLVAANHGDYDATFILNGTPFTVKVTDWCREPHDLTFSYRYVASGERQYIKCGLRVLSLPFEGTLSQIVLPNEVNVHVFAITLELGQ